MLMVKAIGILGLSPLVHCSLSTCRVASPLSYQQCAAQWIDFRFHSRPQFGTSPRRSLHESASSSSITYKLGAAFSAKGRRLNPKEDLFSFNSRKQSSEPFTGRPASGQDAFFVSNVGHGNSIAFGVADGVGGWSDSGIDSADFSHALCRYMIKNAEGNDQKGELAAQNLLSQGYKDVVADTSIQGGGSTACVAVGHPDGLLQVANLGDSGFVQFRLNAVHYWSNPQTHAFNTPYQLSIIPPKILARSRIFGGMPLRDFPRDASITNHEVRHGDVLVFATDGVWDNLNSSELLQIVSRHMAGFQAWQTGEKGTIIGKEIYSLTKEGGIPKGEANTLQTMLAMAITGEAKAASRNARRDGPFAKQVQKFYPYEEFHGGKIDDICAVVAIVVGTAQPPG